MYPFRPSVRPPMPHSPDSSLPPSAGPSSLSHLADSPPSDQSLALVRRRSLSVDSDDPGYAPDPKADDDEDFEEITYDELRLSICPADPAHFAPVFGECRPRFVGAVGTQILTRNWPGGQTTSAPTTLPSSPAPAPPSRASGNSRKRPSKSRAQP